jgi:transketolase
MRTSDNIIRQARKLLLEVHFKAGIGHLGGNLSCIDALLLLFLDYYNHDTRIVLSKGHAAGALYVALSTIGVVSKEELLATFHRDDTRFPGHPPANMFREIPFATGSLGHGLSLASGFALSQKMRDAKHKTYCLTSDGEWQEGSTWEALIFACHHELTNLTILVDHNGWQGFGNTRDVASMNPLWERLKGFPSDIHVVDGHDLDAIRKALDSPQRRIKIILLKTIKGHGIPGFENTLASHYLPPSAEQYHDAMKALGEP